jgi:hypothetical protein
MTATSVVGTGPLVLVPERVEYRYRCSELILVLLSLCLSSVPDPLLWPWPVRWLAWSWWLSVLVLGGACPRFPLSNTAAKGLP